MSETEPLRHIVGKAELKSAEITEIKRNRSDDYSQYYEGVSIDLNTQYAQRVMEKRYEGMNNSLQRLHIAWGIARFNDYAKNHKAQLNAMFDELRCDLEKSLHHLNTAIGSQLKHHEKRIGIITKARNYQPMIKSYMSWQFLELLVIFDELMQKIDSATLRGIISDEDQQKLHTEWISRFTQLFFKVRDLRLEVWRYVTAQRDEKRKAKEQPKKEDKPTKDESLTGKEEKTQEVVNTETDTRTDRQTDPKIEPESEPKKTEESPLEDTSKEENTQP